MEEETINKTLDEIIGPPTDISDVISEKGSNISKVAFELYKETAVVLALCSDLYENYGLEAGVLNREQAVATGYIVRMSKFMGSVMALLTDRVKEHGEVILALNRCIIESAMRLRFFSEKATKQDVDDFIKSSLEAERDSYNLIQNNIKEAGKILPIEKRMLDSMDQLFKDSGIDDIKDLDSMPKRKTYKKILKSLEMESGYPFFQGILSHSIHGTWVDLYKHHLEKTDTGFKAKPESLSPDPRLMCPMCIIVLTAIESYVRKYLPIEDKSISLILERIVDLKERNRQIDSLHEKSMLV